MPARHWDQKQAFYLEPDYFQWIAPARSRKAADENSECSHFPAPTKLMKRLVPPLLTPGLTTLLPLKHFTRAKTRLLAFKVSFQFINKQARYKSTAVAKLFLKVCSLVTILERRMYQPESSHSLTTQAY